MGRDDLPPLRFADTPAWSAEIDSGALSRLLAEYRPWRKVRYVAAELGLDPARAWAAVKSHRRTLWRALPLSFEGGASFGYCATPLLGAGLHAIDRAVVGELPARSGASGGEKSAHGLIRERAAALAGLSGYSTEGLSGRTRMIEAAESSIMEGAASTRREALDMLRTGRPARNVGERMILNNFAAMKLIREAARAPLSIELLLELQAQLTEGTLSDDGGVGRFRTAGEPVRIVDARDDSVIFTPPPAGSIRERLLEICAFANEQSDDGFVHPIVRSAIVHFMIGFVHPFVDGNGRTARAAFYWSALRHGYDIFQYLTISEIIRGGYAKYPRAFLDCEQDEGDLTYFILYKLDVISRSLGMLAEHLREELARTERAEAARSLAPDLNLRQRLLVEQALRKPETRFTVKSHATSNDIVPVTARKDLEGLVKARIFVTTKRGKEVIYLLAPGVPQRLAKFT